MTSYSALYLQVSEAIETQTFPILDDVSASSPSALIPLVLAGSVGVRVALLNPDQKTVVAQLTDVLDRAWGKNRTISFRSGQSLAGQLRMANGRKESCERIAELLAEGCGLAKEAGLDLRVSSFLIDRHEGGDSPVRRAVLKINPAKTATSRNAA